VSRVLYLPWKLNVNYCTNAARTYTTVLQRPMHPHYLNHQLAKYHLH